MWVFPSDTIFGIPQIIYYPNDTIYRDGVLGDVSEMAIASIEAAFDAVNEITVVIIFLYHLHQPKVLIKIQSIVQFKKEQIGEACFLIALRMSVVKVVIGA